MNAPSRMMSRPAASIFRADRGLVTTTWNTSPRGLWAYYGLYDLQRSRRHAGACTAVRAVRGGLRSTVSGQELSRRIGIRGGPDPAIRFNGVRGYADHRSCMWHGSTCDRTGPPGLSCRG